MTESNELLLEIKELKNELQELRKQFPIRSYNLKSKIYERAAQESVDYFYEKASNALMLDNRFKVLEYALSKCMKNDVAKDGLFLEFGVFQGESINFCADLVTEKQFIGFDSFEGLPEIWGGKEAKGHFDLNGKLPDVLNNVKLEKGWFDKTLPKYLENNARDVAFLHIDCDLYSSTKTIFDSLKTRIKIGTVIVFDEYFNYPNWQKHEFKAFQEFVQEHHITYEYLAMGILDMAVEITAI